MIWLLLSPVFLLIAIISFLRISRAFRRVAALRAKHAQSRMPRPQRPRTPSDDFHDLTWLPLCQKIEIALEKLGHRLTPMERNRIWRSRSPLIPETLLKEMESTLSAEAVAKALAELPPGIDRPDPTGWCQRA